MDGKRGKPIQIPVSFLHLQVWFLALYPALYPSTRFEFRIQLQRCHAPAAEDPSTDYTDCTE
jgi:hypothetical protein